MSEHFEAVEADFQSHYGLDLRQVLWGHRRFGVRRIWSLVSGLPLDSTTIRMIATGGVDWSMRDELLATLVELVDHSNRMYFSAHARKGTQPWKPIHIPRPAELQEHAAPTSREPATIEEIRAVFGKDIVYDGGGN